MCRGWNGITISRDTIHIEGIELGCARAHTQRSRIGGIEGGAQTNCGIRPPLPRARLLRFKRPVFFERHAVGGEYSAGHGQVGEGLLKTIFYPNGQAHTHARTRARRLFRLSRSTRKNWHIHTHGLARTRTHAGGQAD